MQYQGWMGGGGGGTLSAPPTKNMLLSMDTWLAGFSTLFVQKASSNMKMTTTLDYLYIIDGESRVVLNSIIFVLITLDTCICKWVW